MSCSIQSSSPHPPATAWPAPLRRAPSCRAAFSLIEIMVVVIIIGLLAGAVALKVGDYMDKAKRNRARSDLATMVDAIETYYAEKGRYPTAEEGLAALPLRHTLDPWSRPYQYLSPGRDLPYEVASLGADGREGGEGADADIGNWNLEQD